jgi:hypothetical protein
VYDLPPEFDTTIESWDEVSTYLEAIVQSRHPVVVEMTDLGDDYPRTRVSFRGLLERRRHHNEEVDLFAVVACHRPAGTVRVEPISTPEDESLTSWLVLLRERFEAGRLTTNDGDDYFFLTLRMGGSMVRLMDVNSH